MFRSPEELISMAIEIGRTQPCLDLPIAAVIADSTGAVLSKSRNRVVLNGDVTAHAEILAIQGLGPLSDKSLAHEWTLAVTLEPCPMCAWAIRSAGIGAVIFGAYNNQYGAGGSVFDLLRDGRYGVEVEVIGGVLEKECSLLMNNAFREIRNNRER
ncbi:nucleoside deaminase [Aquiluna sp.]|nr:nucleoside deaminase [Aquiluna sp.]